MGSQQSCLTSENEEKLRLEKQSKLIEEYLEIAQCLLAKCMTTEAYMLQECLLETLQHMKLTKDERNRWIASISNQYQDAMGKMESSTRWTFNMKVCDEKVFDHFKSLSEDQFIRLVVCKKTSGGNEDIIDKRTLIGYYVSKRETTKQDLLKLLGEETTLQILYYSTIDYYDMHLKCIGTDIYSFGNRDIYDSLLRFDKYKGSSIEQNIC